MRAEALMTDNCCALIVSILKNKTRNDAFKELGLKFPTESDYKKDYKLIPDEDREKVKKMYSEDMLSMNEIAAIYNVSAMTVGNYMKRQGIASRNTSESRILMLSKKEVS
jgi:hypothetical protein